MAFFTILGIITFAFFFFKFLGSFTKKKETANHIHNTQRQNLIEDNANKELAHYHWNEGLENIYKRKVEQAFLSFGLAYELNKSNEDYEYVMVAYKHFFNEHEPQVDNLSDDDYKNLKDYALNDAAMHIKLWWENKQKELNKGN